MNAADTLDSPGSDVAVIPARSLGQAMDWSLVLLSQEIESSINKADDGWQLSVTCDQAETAHAAIRLYEAENRVLPWRQEVFHSGLLFDWACAGWAVGVVAFFWLSVRAPGLRDAGILDAQAVLHGEWWRLFTAVWLHGDLGHLAMNLALGLPLLGLAMGGCGSGTGFLAALLAGAAGNIASLAFAYGPHRSLGASGLVMGALGLLAAQWVAVRRGTPRAGRLALGGLAGGVMLFVLFGLSPGTDVVAHAGGFVAGVVLGAGIARRLATARQPHLNVAAAIVSAALVIWTWWLALR
jgi:membrane associated rhomboid family serine protease